MKRIIAVIAALSLIFVPGCGKNEDTGSIKEISVLARGGADKGVIQGLIEDYNKTNTDNIRIKYEEKDDSLGEYLRVALQAGTVPDIFEGLSSATYEIALAKKWLRKLDDDTVEKYRSKMVDGAVRKSSDGNVYTVSTNAGGAFKLIWNKEMFAECGLEPETPPKTWDEVREYAKIMTKNGGGKKYGFALPFKNEGFARLYVMIPGGPSDLFNDNGFEPKTGKFDFTIYNKMTQLFRDMNEEGSVFPSPATLDNDTARAQFAAGNIGMMFAATWDAGVFNNQFPCKMDWGIANIPTFTGEVTGSYVIATCTGGRIMSSNSKHPEEQFKVWEYLHSEKYSKTMQDAGCGISPYKEIGRPELLKTDIKGYKELNFQDDGDPLHYLDVPPAPSVTIKGDNYEKTIAALVSNKADIDEELKKLTDRYNEAVDEWSKKGNDINKYIVPDYNPNTYIPN